MLSTLRFGIPSSGSLFSEDVLHIKSSVLATCTKEHKQYRQTVHFSMPTRVKPPSSQQQYSVANHFLKTVTENLLFNSPLPRSSSHCHKHVSFRWKIVQCSDIWHLNWNLAAQEEHPQLRSIPHVLGTRPSAGLLTSNPVHMQEASLTKYSHVRNCQQTQLCWFSHLLHTSGQ